MLPQTQLTLGTAVITLSRRPGKIHLASMLLSGYHHILSPLLVPLKQCLQCGFSNCNLLQSRFNALSSSLHNNPKGKFVTRVVQMGTEPLFDDVITPEALTTQVNNAKANLSDIGVLVTVSELAYGYQERNTSGSQDVLNAVDVINAHMLPFFAGDATTGVYFIPHAQIGPSPSPFERCLTCPSGQNAWPDVLSDLDYFIEHGSGKKINLDEVMSPLVVSSPFSRMLLSYR